MEFTEKYTTAKLVTDDKKGVEVKKIVVSADTYAQNDMIQDLKNSLEALRQATIKK